MNSTGNISVTSSLETTQPSNAYQGLTESGRGSTTSVTPNFFDKDVNVLGVVAGACGLILVAVIIVLACALYRKRKTSKTSFEFPRITSNVQAAEGRRPLRYLSETGDYESLSDWRSPSQASGTHVINQAYTQTSLDEINDTSLNGALPNNVTGVTSSYVTDAISNITGALPNNVTGVASSNVTDVPPHCITFGAHLAEESSTEPIYAVINKRKTKTHHVEMVNNDLYESY